MNIKLIGHGDITSKDFYTSVLIDHILIGMPPGTLKELKKEDIKTEDIRIIIVTHLLGESYFDLPMFLYHEYLRKRSEPLVIIGPKDLKKKVDKLIKMAFKERIIDDLKVSFLDAASIQNTNVTHDLYFSFVNLKHKYIKNCYGLIIQNDQTSLGYIGETQACPGIPYLLKAVKHCIITVGDDDLSRINLMEFKDLASKFNINYVPVGYPDAMSKKINEVKNAKLIKSGEQFYI